jgi:DNA-binding NarL/FixJ family response regulator
LGAGASVMAALAPFIGWAEESATEALGRSKFQEGLASGRGLGRHAAVRLALGEPEANRTPGDDRGAASLGKRQLEVARMVGEGMSNKQIAARLFLSERTVDSHVRTILNKLGFNSRAQIAGWVASLN